MLQTHLFFKLIEILYLIIYFEIYIFFSLLFDIKEKMCIFNKELL